ncbi:hypothetical protein MHU86_3500 [Fragilaria crotonensis]|nr:hypothetical protein MHU86_3500 [Fragilaria crotonensis]
MDDPQSACIPTPHKHDPESEEQASIKMRTLSEIHQILHQLLYNKKPTSIFETMLKFASLSLAVARRCAPRHPYKYRLFSTARPFRILGLQQIAVGALEKEPHELVGQCIRSPQVTFVSASENVDEDILSLGEPLRRRSRSHDAAGC